MSKKYKILVVDDEQDFVDLIRIVLEKASYQVFSASNGEHCLEIVRVEKPDLVVLDLNLPNMDGHEVCRKIREKFSFKDIAVLMLTVRTLEHDFVSGFGCGSDDYMGKPFEPKELLARIKNLLRQAGKLAVE
ncbi:MAG: response regulator transcription factor [bacterium]|nr:response regulator transcription factor [bacterium]